MLLRNRFFIATVVVALLAWFYFTPHLTFRGMRAAIESGDAARFNDYVNFPALKDNIKGTLNARLVSATTPNRARSRYEDLGTALAAAMIGQLVDALITPESMAMMLKGEKPRPGVIPSAAKSHDDAVDVSMKYETFDRFVVTARNRSGTDEPIILVFVRDGPFSWKLSAVRLPE